MSNKRLSSEIAKDPSVIFSNIKVVPLEEEKSVMTLKPNEEKIFHGDCKLICIEGGGSILNPLPNIIYLIEKVGHKKGEKRKYYIDGMIFAIRAEKGRVVFSIKRPNRWK